VRADVGPGVVQESVAQRQKVPVHAESDRDVVHLLARMVAGAKMLFPILGPGDRAAKANGAKRDQEVFRIELAADAEPATNMEFD